ncbi:MAG: glucose 1-dehydrogenase [Desulfobulbaceae bacterium]|nr:glucose 1-dehydrogenase [Desulfobulbaceae bacterium]
MKDLHGKTALVTGGTRGIGKAISLKLAALGAKVVVNYVRDSKSAERTVTTIEAKGGQALAIQADMKSVEAVRALVDATIEAFGSFDILVNNAGIANYKKIADYSEEEFDEIFSLNVKGVFFACKQAALRMEEGGSIINIGSSVTKVMLPTYGAYAATKGAVEQITKVLAKELGPKNIRVNTLSPGPVDTELFRMGKSQEQMDSMAGMAAFGRLGVPSDIAGMVALLVSDEAFWLTGQNICVNGGFIS